MLASSLVSCSRRGLAGLLPKEALFLRGLTPGNRKGLKENCIISFGSYIAVSYYNPHHTKPTNAS